MRDPNIRRVFVVMTDVTAIVTEVGDFGGALLHHGFGAQRRRRLVPRKTSRFHGNTEHKCSTTSFNTDLLFWISIGELLYLLL